MLERFYFVRSLGVTRAKGSTSARTLQKQADPKKMLGAPEALKALERGTISIKIEKDSWEAFYKQKKATSKLLQVLQGLSRSGRSMMVKMLSAHSRGQTPTHSKKDFQQLSEEISGQLNTLMDFMTNMELQLEEVKGLSATSSPEECAQSSLFILFQCAFFLRTSA